MCSVDSGEISHCLYCVYHFQQIFYVLLIILTLLEAGIFYAAYTYTILSIGVKIFWTVPNIVDSDDIPPNAASRPGLHCLLSYVYRHSAVEIGGNIPCQNVRKNTNLLL